MSFMKTLVNVGIGFAAAKGLERYNRMGGMAGMRQMMEKSGSGSMVDQMGQMADKMGVPGGSQAMRDMMARFGMGSTAASDTQVAGVSGMMSAMGGAAAATGGNMADMFAQMTEGTAAGQMAEDNAKLMIRAMIQAAKADGEIDSEEQAKILEHLQDADPEEIAFVKDQLTAPLDPMELAKDANEQSRAQVYAMSLTAITVDNHAEVKYLDTLAAALGLDQAMRDRIHTQMGVTAAP